MTVITERVKILEGENSVADYYTHKIFNNKSNTIMFLEYLNVESQLKIEEEKREKNGKDYRRAELALNMT